MAVKPFPTGLPSGVHLDDLKDQAKTLLKAVGAAEPFALERIKPYFDDPSSLTLQRAQLVIAREHGFSSWRKTRAFVEARDEMLANPLPEGGRPEAKDQVERRLGLARRMASALLEILEPDRSTRYCSFCFKSQHEAFKFIAGTGSSSATPASAYAPDSSPTTRPPASGATTRPRCNAASAANAHARFGRSSSPTPTTSATSASSCAWRSSNREPRPAARKTSTT